MGIPREELLQRMASPELSTWMAFFAVKAEEAELQRHKLESGDGQVFVSGRDRDEDLEDGDDDGTTE